MSTNDVTATKFNFEGTQVELHGASNDEYIFSKILKDGSFYERTFLRYLRFCVRKPGCFVDAGANIGNHTIFFSVIMSRRCISFEPNPEAYAVLRENIAINNSSAVAYELGLSNTSCRARILKDGLEIKNLGATTLVQDSLTENGISMRSLDEIMVENHSNEKVAVIKVDVEGFEDKVLAGSKDILIRDKPSVFVEAIDAPAHLAVKSVLEPLGYKEVCVVGGTPMYHFVHNASYAEVFRSRIWQAAFMVWKVLRFVRQFPTGRLRDGC